MKYSFHWDGTTAVIMLIPADRREVEMLSQMEPGDGTGQKRDVSAFREIGKSIYGIPAEGRTDGRVLVGPNGESEYDALTLRLW